jgi:hypothetical protein
MITGMREDKVTLQEMYDLFKQWYKNAYTMLLHREKLRSIFK